MFRRYPTIGLRLRLRSPSHASLPVLASNVIVLFLGYSQR
jgi:hypothetical protein